MKQMLEPTDKNLKQFKKYIFYIFKNIEKYHDHIMERHQRYIKIKLMEMKNIVCEIKMHWMALSAD